MVLVVLKYITHVRVRKTLHMEKCSTVSERRAHVEDVDVVYSRQVLSKLYEERERERITLQIQSDIEN